MSSPSAAGGDRRHFLLRRLHSLSGVIPVGVFLCIHLWTNTKAIQGKACFDHAVENINTLPFLPFIEIFGIFVPILFHGIYGVKLAFEAKPNVGGYGYARNWMYVLQRATGLFTLVFIFFHVNDFRVAKLFGHMLHADFFDALRTQLGWWPKALFYVLGVTASVFHFVNGLRTLAFSWGLTVSERSQRATAWAVGALGVVLWFLGTNTVLFFNGGVGFVPSSIVRGEGGRDVCDESLAPLRKDPRQKPEAAPSAHPSSVPQHNTVAPH